MHGFTSATQSTNVIEVPKKVHRLKVVNNHKMNLYTLMWMKDFFFGSFWEDRIPSKKLGRDTAIRYD